MAQQASPPLADSVAESPEMDFPGRLCYPAAYHVPPPPPPPSFPAQRIPPPMIQTMRFREGDAIEFEAIEENQEILWYMGHVVKVCTYSRGQR